MAVTRAKKEEVLAQLEAAMQKTQSIAFVTTQKITVAESTSLRKDLRAVDAEMIIAKKRLIQLAFKNTYGQELSDDMLPGAAAAILSYGDAMAGMGVAAKYTKEKLFKKEQKLVFSSAYIEGKILDAQDAQKLASIPSREVLLAKLLGSMISPLSAMARFFDAAGKEMEVQGVDTVGKLTPKAE